MAVLFVGKIVTVLMLVRHSVRVRAAVVRMGKRMRVQVRVVPLQRVDNDEFCFRMLLQIHRS